MNRSASRFVVSSSLLAAWLIACGSDGGGGLTADPDASAGDSGTAADSNTTSADSGTKDSSTDAKPAGSFTIGGSVNGLLGAGLVLKNNGGDDLSVGAADGGAVSFVFANKVSGAYAVTVSAQPSSPAQVCTVASGSGTASANVTNVSVTCATSTFTVGGNVTGLGGGETVTISNSGGPNHDVTADGPFTAPNALADGSPYEVLVVTSPAGKKCGVTDGTGTISGANVTNVAVACVPACGDGVIDAGEACDDGNAMDGDACSNACALNPITLGGNAQTYINQALGALGETFVAATNAGFGSWGNAPSTGILISSNDGGGGAFDPAYQTFLDAGGHILMIGGSNSNELRTPLGNFLTLGATISWHQSSDCTSDWNTTNAHPITSLIPATYEFANQATSYHMLHFSSTQPAGVTLLGDTCHAAGEKTVAAVRNYASGGTFTYMGLDIGQYDGTNTNVEFVRPFLQGYLAYVRSKK